MILNNAPVNEAIVSNVGEIGEFRIRNSANCSESCCLALSIQRISNDDAAKVIGQQQEQGS